MIHQRENKIGQRAQEYELYAAYHTDDRHSMHCFGQHGTISKQNRLAFSSHAMIKHDKRMHVQEFKETGKKFASRGVFSKKKWSV